MDPSPLNNQLPVDIPINNDHSTPFYRRVVKEELEPKMDNRPKIPNFTSQGMSKLKHHNALQRSKQLLARNKNSLRLKTADGPGKNLMRPLDVNEEDKPFENLGGYASISKV
jgi:hypothetical protein